LANDAAVIRNLLIRLYKLQSRLTMMELRDLGITGPQLLVLREINGTRRTIGQIAKAVQLSYSTVSGIIDRLERDGLIGRTRDTEDRRVVWIQPTAMFEEKKQRKKEFFSKDHEGDWLKELTQEEIDTFVKSLRMFINHLEKKAEKRQ